MLPELKIGNLTARLPIIQGGMGVGISLSRLASAVANEGGIGIISGVQIGFREKDFDKNPIAANLRAIKTEIEKARKLSPSGIIGMNFMTVMQHYEDYVREAVKNGIDLIISGAGLPLALPKLVEGTATKILPIVSSARACKIIMTSWLKHDNRLPDGVVVEGPLAGGHLGFKMQELLDGTYQTLDTAVKEVLQVVKGFEDKFNVSIPVIAAGGISSYEDIKKYLDIGASGVQIGTQFVATEECDASDYFKQQYVSAGTNDIKIIKSPAGLPARAINNEFLKTAYNDDGIPVKKCFNCLSTCDPSSTRYCISKALFDSANGTGGLVFTGGCVDKIKEITTVHKLIAKLSGN